MSTTTPHVYIAISAVMSDMATNGIAKGRQNKAQGFAFRGIDDVYAALSRSMVTHKLMMLPRAISHKHDVRVTSSGNNQYIAIMDMEFDLVSAEDGSKHTIRTWGEAQDSGDKSTNKAMSAAFKYAAFQAFCIPVEGDNDADAHTPEPTVSAATRYLTGLQTSVDAIHSVDDLSAYFKSSQAEMNAMLEGDDLKRANGIFNKRKAALTTPSQKEAA